MKTRFSSIIERNGQNYPKSLFLNAFINVEISFQQIGSKYSLQLIKWGIFHSSGSIKTEPFFDKGQGVESNYLKHLLLWAVSYFFYLVNLNLV